MRAASISYALGGGLAVQTRLQACLAYGSFSVSLYRSPRPVGHCINVQGEQTDEVSVRGVFTRMGAYWDIYNAAASAAGLLWNPKSLANCRSALESASSQSVQAKPASHKRTPRPMHAGQPASNANYVSVALPEINIAAHSHLLVNSIGYLLWKLGTCDETIEHLLWILNRAVM